MTEKKKIIIVGCGPGGDDYVTPAARKAAAKADVLIVSQRLMGLFPEVKAERIDSGTDVEGTLAIMAARREAGLQVVLLATGDPGIASLARPVIRRFGRENCEVIPGISSIQTAFARLGLEWTDAKIVPAHAKDPDLSAAELRDERKIVLLGGRDGSILWAAGLIGKLGERRRCFLCEELTLPAERIREVRAEELPEMQVSSRALIVIVKEELMS